MTADHEDTCGSCGRAFVWAVHETTLKPAPILLESSADGNIALVERPGQAPMYRVLSVTARFGRHDLRKNHFADCPKAERYRRRRP